MPRDLPGAVQPGRTQPAPLPAPQAPDFELTIESLRRSAAPETADQITFRLNGIQLHGATAFPIDHFAPLYSRLIGQQVRLADIAAVADAIESAYHKAGFLLTRAYVPPQRVHDGVFEIDVVEGYVSGVAVVTKEGKPLLGYDLETIVSGYFADVLRQRPLSDAVIERAMLLANDVPGRTASGLLRPSADKPGASELVVTEGRERFSPTVSIDNRGSKFAGPVLLHLGGALSPGLRGGDWLSGSFSATPTTAERIDAAVNYALPVGPNGLIASFNASGSYGKPGASLSPISLVTSSYAFGPHLRYPVLRSRAQSLYIDAGLSVRAADVASLGQPFSHDDWRTFDASITYVERGWLAGASSVAITLTQGLPILGASRNGAAELSRPGAATDFTKLSVTAQRIQRLYGPFSLSISFQGQYAFAPLIAGEQIAFGGDSIGRGYDPAALLGDHGVGGGVELRYDHLFSDSWLKSAEPYLFSDTGAVWNRRAVAGGNDRLASVGAGVRLQIVHNISATVEFAKAVWSVADNDNGRRSSRVLFDLGIRL